MKTNSLPSIFSKLFWYHFLSDLKIFFITSFASSLIIISMLFLFECITRSSSLSSLEEIILIVIANWIFHALDFVRPYMICSKYGLIVLRYLLIDSVLFQCYLHIQYKYYSKKYNSYWFIIILFYFMQEKISNTTFFFFFLSKTIYFIFNYVTIYFFQSKKIYFIFSYIFFLYFLFLQILSAHHILQKK